MWGAAEGARQNIERFILGVLTIIKLFPKILYLSWNEGKSLALNVFLGTGCHKVAQRSVRIRRDWQVRSLVKGWMGPSLTRITKLRRNIHGSRESSVPSVLWYALKSFSVSFTLTCAFPVRGLSHGMGFLSAIRLQAGVYSPFYHVNCNIQVKGLMAFLQKSDMHLAADRQCMVSLLAGE